MSANVIRTGDWSLGRRFAEAGLLLACILVAPAVALRSSLRPADPLSAVAVIYAPWVSETAAIERATLSGASLMATGRFGAVVIVRPSAPGYVDRVLANGALLAIDPVYVAFCDPVPSAGEL